MATPIASSDSSPEYTTMIEYKEKLIATLSEHVGDVSTFSSKLVIYKLISSIPSASSKGAQTLTEHTKDYRAQKIVSEVTAKIKDDPTVFHKFVQLLSEHPQLRKFSNELKECKKSLLGTHVNKQLAVNAPRVNASSRDLAQPELHLQLPCLGRPLKLGVFYDCHNEKLIIGINKAVLSKCEPHTSVNYKVIHSDSLQDKAVQLGLTPGLQLSLLAGLVQDISGSAKYWNDRISSKRVVRVCLKYESTSYVKQLAVDKLGDIQCNTFDAATHVVTRVLYGLRIVFVFDRVLSQGEDYNYVHGNMMKMVTNLSHVNNTEDSSLLNALLADTEEVNKYKCKVYSDLKELSKTSCTLPETVKVYRGLFSQRREDTVQKVWLYPLSKVNEQCIQPISIDHIINQVQSLLGYLYSLEIQASDILSKHSPILSKFNHLQERLTKFSDIIVVHRNETKKSLTEKLPLIREKKVDEAELSKIVKEASASPFSSQHLSSWLTQVSEEIARVQTLYDRVSDMEFASSRELQSIIEAIDSDHVVCFAFNIGGDEDHTLKSMQSHSQKETTLEGSSACVSVKPWYTNTDLMEAILRRIEQFKSFAKENKRKAVRFLVTNNSHKGGEIGSILLYKGNTSEVFEPPSAPGKPTASNVTQDKVQLEWTKPDYGSKNIHCYNISYYPTDNPKSYKTISTNSAEKTATISGLTAGTGYVFKVQPECVCGVGTESEASDRIETQIVSSPPTNSNVEGTVCSTKPVASVVTHNSIQLKWTPPQTCNGSIECYTIFYRLANDPNSKWKRKNTENDEQTLTVTGLTPDTSYIFKVRPEMEDRSVGTESDFSDTIYTKAISSLHKQIVTTNVTYGMKTKHNKVSNASEGSKAACKPGKITVKTRTHNSIELHWRKPEYFSDFVQCYTVSYREKTFNINWESRNTKGSENSIVLINLKPKTLYTFKVLPQCFNGIRGIETIFDPKSNVMTCDKPLAERVQDGCAKLPDMGPPDIYKVQVNKQNIKVNMIAKCHVNVGKPIPTNLTKERVVMLVGATGAGKSTLINLMVNYIYGVHWEHSFRFKLITSESSLSQAHSQTLTITAYTFYPMEGSPLKYTLTIVDTPGFGDTRGIQRDKEITRNVKEFFSVKPPDGIDHIDAIGFVVQASNPRLTPTQKYVFDSVLSVFGKDIAENIFLMCTFADGQKPQVLEAITAANIKYAKEFRFNNSALFSKPDEIGKFYWGMNYKHLKWFFDELKHIKPKSLQLTKDVLETRESLEISIQGLQEQISAGLSLAQELQQEQNLIKEHGEKLINKQDNTYEIEVSKRVEVELQDGLFVTNCLVCNFTCHFPCDITDDNKKYNCAAMGGSWISRNKQSKCQICPGKCSWKQHINNPFRYEIRQVMETRTFGDLVKRYVQEGDSDQEETAEKVKSGISSQLHKVSTHVYNLIKETRRYVEKLEEIALRPSPLDEVAYIELMIESERRDRSKGCEKRISTLEGIKEKALLLSKATEMDEEEAKQSTLFWNMLGQNSSSPRVMTQATSKECS